MDLIERNKNLVKKFETMINTNDKELAHELVAPDALFYTPASPKPLYGGEGYLAVVDWMRKGFPDIQWHLKEMVADSKKVAVRWDMTGTHTGCKGTVNLKIFNRQFEDFKKNYIE